MLFIDENKKVSFPMKIILAMNHVYFEVLC